MSALPPGRGMSHIEVFQGQIKQYMVWSCRSESLIWAPGRYIHIIYIQVTTSTSLLSPFFLYIYIYVLFIYIYVHIWIRRYDFPPKSFQKGSSGLFGAWQRANSSHCTHIWSHTSIYIYKYKHRKLLGKQCAIVCTAYTSWRVPLVYKQRGRYWIYIYIYICTPSCLLNRTSEWHILSLLGGKALSLFQVPWSARERERCFLFNIYIINIYIYTYIFVAICLSIYLYIYIYPRLKDVIIYIHTYLHVNTYNIYIYNIHLSSMPHVFPWKASFVLAGDSLQDQT